MARAAAGLRAHPVALTELDCGHRSSVSQPCMVPQCVREACRDECNGEDFRPCGQVKWHEHRNRHQVCFDQHEGKAARWPENDAKHATLTLQSGCRLTARVSRPTTRSARDEKKQAPRSTRNRADPACPRAL